MEKELDSDDINCRYFSDTRKREPLPMNLIRTEHQNALFGNFCQCSLCVMNENAKLVFFFIFNLGW